MALPATDNIDDEIRAAAMVSFNATEVGVRQYIKRDKIPQHDSGLWYSLHYRQSPEAPWRCGGLRRSKEALLILAKRGPVVLDDWPKRDDGDDLREAWAKIKHAPPAC